MSSIALSKRPATARLPIKGTPNRTPSSSEKAITSISIGNFNSCAISTHSSAIATPSTPSYAPASGTVSMCDPISSRLPLAPCGLPQAPQIPGAHPHAPSSPSASMRPRKCACTTCIGAVRNRRVMRPGSSVIAAMLAHSAITRSALSLIRAPTLFRAQRQQIRPRQRPARRAARSRARAPSDFAPRYGDSLCRKCRSSAPTVHAASGSKTTKSASAPTASVPFRPAQSRQPRRCRGHPHSQLFNSKSAPRHRSPQHRQRQAQARNSSPRQVPAAFFSAFHRRRARGVVRDHHIQFARSERLPQRFAICSLANRRRAFVLRRSIRNLFRGKPQIVHARLHADRHSAPARLCNHRQRLRARKMHDMDRRLIFISQPNQQCDRIKLRSIRPRGQIG